MIILGIDTSLRCTGYGVVEQKARTPLALRFGVIKPRPPNLIPNA